MGWAVTKRNLSSFVLARYRLVFAFVIGQFVCLSSMCLEQHPDLIGFLITQGFVKQVF